MPAGSSHAILIALLLRCLVLTHEIYVLELSVPFRTFENNETHHRVEQGHGHSSIEISKSSNISQAGYANLEQQNRESLPSILEEILQTIEKSMFRRGSKDWPMLLCALCLLRLKLINLSPYSLWLRTLKPTTQAMTDVNYILCRLYEMYSYRCHSLLITGSLQTTQDS